MRAGTALLLFAGILPAQEAAWQTLFDGRDLSHWTGGIDLPVPQDSWRLEDGWLVAVPSPVGASLYSREQYRDFELEFEWKVPAGANTGVKYRCRPEWTDPYYAQVIRPRAELARVIIVTLLLGAAGATWLLRSRRWWRWITGGVAFLALLLLAAGSWLLYVQDDRVQRHPPGLEYQITDDTADIAIQDTSRTASLYDLLPARTPGPPALNAAHRSRIIVRGNAVEHWLDGERVLEYALGSSALKDRVAGSKFSDLPGFADASEGYLQIQHHQTAAAFRNIRVRRLSP